jgi:hypothetical protein
MGAGSVEYHPGGEDLDRQVSLQGADSAENERTRGGETVSPGIQKRRKGLERLGGRPRGRRVERSRERPLGYSIRTLGNTIPLTSNTNHKVHHTNDEIGYTIEEIGNRKY